MRTEPDLDRGALIVALHAQWGLDVVRLDFVPYGLDSWSYVATTRPGERAFVKLSRAGVSSNAGGSELPLLIALRGQDVPVPRPFATPDGRLTTTFEGFELQVQEYLAGRSLEDETAWPDDLYRRVADIVAAVHASTAAVKPLVDRIETYDLPFLADLVATLRAIKTGLDLPSADAATIRELRDLVGPRAQELGRALGRLEALRDAAARIGSETVLCHTDIWGSNLIVAEDGALGLLDWDGARLGPPEQDLFMFAGTSFFPGERLAWFLDRYEAAFRPVRLDRTVLGFYLYRRNLEDLAGFVGSLAANRMEAMAPAAMLRIVAALLTEISEIEGHLARVTTVLAGRAGRSGSRRGA